MVAIAVVTPNIPYSRMEGKSAMAISRKCELAHMKRHREGKKEQIETGTLAQ
jgi:hypothetical protein